LREHASLTHLALSVPDAGTMRGRRGEFILAVAEGSSTGGVVDLSGIKVLPASHPEEVPRFVEAAAGQAYNASHAYRRSLFAASESSPSFHK